MKEQLQYQFNLVLEEEVKSRWHFWSLGRGLCRVNCLYVSVTNTKAYATLVTEYILFWLCIVIFLFFLIDVISVILLML